MMHIFQTSKPEVVNLLREHFVYEDGWTEDELAHQLYVRMMNSPAHTCVLLSVDDENTLQGFIIGWDVLGRHYCWIDMAWSRHENKEDSKNVLKTFEDWCVLKRGKREIRMQTQRSEKAFSKSYGFKYHRTIMSKEL
jgi:hypothetical protein